LAPEKMSDLEKWPAPLRKIWDAAIDKEWDGLNGRNTFIHGITSAGGEARSTGSSAGEQGVRGRTQDDFTVKTVGSR
jgi:hypothetical protein